MRMRSDCGAGSESWPPLFHPAGQYFGLQCLEVVEWGGIVGVGDGLWTPPRDGGAALGHAVIYSVLGQDV